MSAPTNMATLTDTINRLVLEQQSVRKTVEQLDADRWDAHPEADVMAMIRSRGHFAEYDCEVAWSARLVIGHLTDSARIFAERIVRTRTGDEPQLADFVTDEAERLARYSETGNAAALSDLSEAQTLLVSTLRQLMAADLRKTAVHEVDGLVTLGSMVAFLPDHQRDHAQQLLLLTTSPAP